MNILGYREIHGQARPVAYQRGIPLADPPTKRKKNSVDSESSSESDSESGSERDSDDSDDDNIPIVLLRNENDGPDRNVNAEDAVSDHTNTRPRWSQLPPDSVNESLGEPSARASNQNEMQVDGEDDIYERSTQPLPSSRMEVDGEDAVEEPTNTRPSLSIQMDPTVTEVEITPEQMQILDWLHAQWSEGPTEPTVVELGDLFHRPFNPNAMEVDDAVDHNDHHVCISFSLIAQHIKFKCKSI